MYLKTLFIHFCWLSCSFLIFQQSAKTQDLHFSQFNHASVLLSPTETGNYHGDWRVINNHRNQWANIGKPLTTTALAFDKQVYIYNQKLSIGGQYVFDESGNYRMVHQKFLLAAAYHQTIGYQTFRIGIQGGLVQKRLNSGGLAWPDQWDQGSGEFNNQLSTNELFINRIIYYPDINIGGAYSTRVWKLKPEFTLALFHVNRPSESFLYMRNRLRMRKVFYVRTPFDLKGKWSLDPQFLFMWQSKSVDFVVGSYANYGLAKNVFRAKQAFAGLSLRNSVTRNWDAFIVTGGIQFKRLRAAISYDITVSDLRLANSYSGAIEFAIIYTGISSVLNQRAIPCKRI